MSGDRLAHAIRSLRGTRERPPASDIRQQLEYLERDLHEVRTRVNALFFAVITAVLGNLVTRLVV
jgi:hypothetical protein